jgi:large subunit ribosomal protein L30
MSDATTPAAGQLRITLVRSVIGRPVDQERTVQSLGLRHVNQTVEREDTPSCRGLVNMVRHLFSV